MLDALRSTPCYKSIPSKVWQQEWVLHCEPVGSGLGALKYLAPYIFRVAMSNNRILKLENDHVTFRYRDTETGTENVAPWVLKTSSIAFSSMSYPKASSRSVIMACLAPASAKHFLLSGTS